MRKGEAMRAFRTLFKIEFILSLRDMNMPIFALGMPVVVTVIMGMLYAGQPAYDGAGYSFIDQSFGAMASIGICAGGAMGLPLVVAGYRSRKILKRYFVTPVSPGMLLGVQVAVYAVYAIASAALVYLVAALCFGMSFGGSWLGFAGSFLLVMASMFGIGMLVGGTAKNERIASVLASAAYFPMLLFSGATVPYEVMPQAIQRIVDVLPLTQGIKLLKASSLGLSLDDAIVPIVVLVAWGVVCGGLAIKFFKWE